jgi:hypothetical protein
MLRCLPKLIDAAHWNGLNLMYSVEELVVNSGDLSEHGNFDNRD